MTTTSPRHGKATTYKAGCRCTKCREANRLYQQAANARRASDPALADRAGHGRASTYINYACRCEPCREANTRRLRTQREQRAMAKGRAA
ncbi:hypothetical protein O3S80_04120 [Streptomyces sp. Lzd4kr]|nr:hypothetical protein [Streptomyces sp. Lzd4kr]